MATETMNYGYPKPGEDDFYDISQFNQALDMIDQDMKEMDREKQNKLGIGTFKENIDILGEGGLPQANSVCLCRAKALRGILPYESQEDYWFTLETNTVSGNQVSSERSQRAVVYGGDNIKIFERLFMEGEWHGWKEILRADGDTKDNIATFQSGDTENPTGWADVSPIESGERHSSLWRKFSLGIKNLRYLKKLLGTTDISKVADGTLTGAISMLNTGMHASDWKESNISFVDCTNAIAAGAEAFLDHNVDPIAAEGVPHPSIVFKNITSIYNGPGYTALVCVHWAGHFGGILFGYDGTFIQFRKIHNVYGIRKL